MAALATEVAEVARYSFGVTRSEENMAQRKKKGLEADLVRRTGQLLGQSSYSLGGSSTAGLAGLRCSKLQRAVAALLLGGMEEHPVREALPSPRIAVGLGYSSEQEVAASLLVVGRKLDQVACRVEPRNWAWEVSSAELAGRPPAGTAGALRVGLAESRFRAEVLLLFAGGGQFVLAQRLGRLKFVRPKFDLVQHPIVVVEAARVLPDLHLSPWTSAPEAQQ